MELIHFAIYALHCVATSSTIPRENGELKNPDNNNNFEVDQGSNRRSIQQSSDKEMMDDGDGLSAYKKTYQSSMPVAAARQREADRSYDDSFVITRADIAGVVGPESSWIGPVFCKDDTFANGYNIYQDHDNCGRGCDSDPKGLVAIKLICNSNPARESNAIITGKIAGEDIGEKYCTKKGPDEYHTSPQSADQFIVGAEGLFLPGEGVISFYPICDIPDEGTRKIAVESSKLTSNLEPCKDGSFCSTYGHATYGCNVDYASRTIRKACCKSGHSCGHHTSNYNYNWCWIDDHYDKWSDCKKSIHTAGVPWRKMFMNDAPSYSHGIRGMLRLMTNNGHRRSCPVGQAICGIDARVDSEKTGSDKSGIQEIKIFCCTVPYII